MSKPISVTVKILGKDYQIACLPDEQQSLIDSASYLDSKMREVKEKGKTYGLERVAVMTALNLSHELLTLQASTSGKSSTVNDTIERSNKKLDDALHRLKQLEI